MYILKISLKYTNVMQNRIKSYSSGTAFPITLTMKNSARIHKIRQTKQIIKPPPIKIAKVMPNRLNIPTNMAYGN